jgi:hypothetical protein
MASVKIWQASPRKYQVFGDGHAGLEIQTLKGIWYYITWYPRRDERPILRKGETNMSIGFAQIRNKEGQLIDNPVAHGRPGAMTFRRDRDLMKRPPDQSIEVPVRDEGTLFGLCMDRMESFWERVLSLPPGDDMRRFGLISHYSNCAGMVTNALLVGRLGLFAMPPFPVIYQDARTLSEWVTKAAERIRAMNDLHDNFHTSILGDPLILANGGPPKLRTVPILEQWKKESDQGIAFYARRKDQIAEIDFAISRYHLTSSIDKVKRLAWMHKILWFVYNHLVRKPNSDRRRAVLRLAVRVNAAVEDLSKEVDQEPIDYPIQPRKLAEPASDEVSDWEPG